MTPTDIIWLFFMFSALQPVLSSVFSRRARALIAKIERQRTRGDSPRARQETMSILGFPVFRYIDVNDSEEVLRAIYLTDRRCRWTSCCTPQAVWCSPRCRSPAPFTSIAAR